MFRRRHAPVCLILMAALAASACRPTSSAEREPVGFGSVVEGSATLTRHGESAPLGQESSLELGDAIALEGTGLVQIELTGGRSLSLAEGTLELLSPGTVDLQGGRLLVTTSSPVQVRVARAAASIEVGTVRFDATGDARIGAYDAESARIKGGTREVEIPAYWQVSVSRESELEQARPLQFAAGDEWDQRFLSGALDIDSQIANLVRGLASQLGESTPTNLFERLAAAGVTAEDLLPFAQLSPADLVLALAFARTWKDGAPQELPRAFSQALGLHALGATWGLLAQQFSVSGPEFIRRLQEEINSVALPVLPEPPAAPSTPQVSGPQRPSASATPQPGEPQPAATPAPTPSPATPLLPALSQELTRILDELFGIVGELLPIS